MKKQFDLSAAALHILAMALMLCDHLWATLLPAQEWMTAVGRIAFPIFAFMAVEAAVSMAPVVAAVSTITWSKLPESTLQSLTNLSADMVPELNGADMTYRLSCIGD